MGNSWQAWLTYCQNSEPWSLWPYSIFPSTREYHPTRKSFPPAEPALLYIQQKPIALKFIYGREKIPFGGIPPQHVGISLQRKHPHFLLLPFRYPFLLLVVRPPPSFLVLGRMPVPILRPNHPISLPPHSLLPILSLILPSPSPHCLIPPIPWRKGLWRSCSITGETGSMPGCPIGIQPFQPFLP